MARWMRFLNHGWDIRYAEFRNSLSDGALMAYLWQFWQPRAERAGLKWPYCTALNARTAELFDGIYIRRH